MPQFVWLQRHARADAGHDVVGQRGAVVARAYRRAVAEQQCPAAERLRYDELRRCGLPGRDP